MIIQAVAMLAALFVSNEPTLDYSNFYLLVILIYHHLFFKLFYLYQSLGYLVGSLMCVTVAEARKVGGYEQRCIAVALSLDSSTVPSQERCVLLFINPSVECL